MLAGLTTIDVAKALDNLIYTKSPPWAYEREWRIFAGDGRDKNASYEDVPFGSDELAGVVLGARMPDAEVREFYSLAKSVNAKAQLYQAKLTPNRSLSLAEL